MIDRLDGLDYTFMAFCVWRHHLAYLARKAYRQLQLFTSRF